MRLKPLNQAKGTLRKQKRNLTRRCEHTNQENLKKVAKRTVVKTEDKAKRDFFLEKGLRGDEKTL